jgi:hypothetical protein
MSKKESNRKDADPTTEPGADVPTTEPGADVPTTEPGADVPTTEPGAVPVGVFSYIDAFSDAFYNAVEFVDTSELWPLVFDMAEELIRRSKTKWDDKIALPIIRILKKSRAAK